MLRKFSRILVAEDSRATRKVVCGMLGSLGFENIDQADDGLAALDLLKRHRYNLIVSDWDMSPMDGLALLETVRTGTFGVVPFILMTGQRIRFAEIARDNGLMHYLLKPFTRDQLGTKLLQAMSGPAA